MTSYVFNFSNGATSEGHFTSDAEAQAWAESILEHHGHDPSEIVTGDWDANGANDDDQPMERMLFWANEADSQDDPGRNAIASLEVVRSLDHD